MAKLVGVLQTSHGPFTTLAPDRWESMREGRSYRSDVPVESPEDRAAKAARCEAGIRVLSDKLAEMRPDVLVVFGDDQYECFDFTNFPALWLYVGDTFAGADREGRGRPEAYHTVPGHPGLGVHLLSSLLDSGYDPAFSMGLPNPEKGMCHAIMRPLEYFGAYGVPTVPILVNGYYAPAASAARIYQIGKAVRRAIDSYPDDLRVVVIGSGGMWHTPGRRNSYLDEEFDLACLRFVEKGDIKGMAEFFDSYQVSDDDRSQDIGPGTRGTTGMPAINGPQLGTREICNWIGAAATADGRPSVIVDYIPIYASPIGTAFAYCDDV